FPPPTSQERASTRAAACCFPVDPYPRFLPGIPTTSSISRSPAGAGREESRAELLERLEEHAYRIRRYALQMGEVQGQGYIGQALGIADTLAVAYCHALSFRPADPSWEDRDGFLLSH